MVLQLDGDDAEGGNEEAKNGDDCIKLADIEMNSHDGQYLLFWQGRSSMSMR